ncbi:hypothetical protein [Vibrio splendidus]|uniref:hypothetical protein n=1 Tax=Vibrio splendidus TaxID=29497 RepID=UPI00021C2F2C|nr:hypothetical protein [Vibrio splendidus]EGU38045.1 hypothetical protein VISP3789_16953 [Vibrio splendidus ATCC 33789]
MQNNMDLPQYYGLVKCMAKVGAGLGCISGAVAILGGLGMFKFGFMAGMTAISGGVLTVIMSLAGLGVTFCFLAMVKAQIDTRNAIIRFTESKIVEPVSSGENTHSRTEVPESEKVFKPCTNCGEETYQEAHGFHLCEKCT